MGSITAPTRNEINFHKVSSARPDKSFEMAMREDRLTQDDIDLIYEFIAELEASQNIGLIRKNKIIYTLVNWRRFICPYREAKLSDIYKAISNLKSAKTSRGRPYKINTVHDYVMFIKRISLWMIENGYSDLPKEKIQKIKPPRADKTTKRPDQMLSKEDIESIIRGCLTSRDRALISVLYESGCRISELGCLTWGRIRFDEYGVILTIEDTKCSTQRYVRLVMAKPYLSAWRQDYPFEPKGDSLAFITHRKDPLTYDTTVKIIRRVALRGGVEKHITPHIFRHSRITHLINEGMNESVIKLMMWGNINTPMFQTYAHLTGGDIDREVLGSYGIVPKDEKETHALEPLMCPKCMTINPPKAEFCNHCGVSFTEDAQDTIEEMAKDVNTNPEILKRMIEEIIEERMKTNAH
ncbi:tyrosine-type recombinase/integrase [Methanoplanus sp. FWC-SCC4]|uniref:Tyrosine-type recombinase/integrase n=1 Tax=Methanochimaera problematica TaxID=2609417 RepID=A0AA97FEG6_9EURY|nr:site-specific integrase [Methanoplanus sp. FWC-SCC4]WOF16788.1 tyrosine-type recombinase/integrase [Methanoplanus sp. FWC-SCC4]